MVTWWKHRKNNERKCPLQTHKKANSSQLASFNFSFQTHPHMKCNYKSEWERRRANIKWSSVKIHLLSHTWVCQYQPFSINLFVFSLTFAEKYRSVGHRKNKKISKQSKVDVFAIKLGRMRDKENSILLNNKKKYGKYGSVDENYANPSPKNTKYL